MTIFRKDVFIIEEKLLMKFDGMRESVDKSNRLEKEVASHQPRKMYLKDSIPEVGKIVFFFLK